MHVYSPADIVCLFFFSVRFWEQITSSDKYPSIFSRHMEVMVFVIHQIYFGTRAVLKIGEYHSDIPFSHVTRLHQSRASENI